jgi:hypothetical protein
VAYVATGNGQQAAWAVGGAAVHGIVAALHVAAGAKTVGMAAGAFKASKALRGGAAIVRIGQKGRTCGWYRKEYKGVGSQWAKANSRWAE